MSTLRWLLLTMKNTKLVQLVAMIIAASTLGAEGNDRHFMRAALLGNGFVQIDIHRST